MHCSSHYHDTSIGWSRIFERGIPVQADYGNSTNCFITAGEYVYAEAVKSAPIRAKRGNFSNLWPLRSHLLAFQAPLSEHWSGSRRNCCICSTSPVGLIASFCSWLVKLTISSQWPCRQIFVTSLHFWLNVVAGKIQIEQNSCTMYLV